ncbi:hypothetical protein, partial [Microtetraspora malaysiensis]|uniref:hypothetical protein n=1 Tax=Microtetraspora malaysiensis TaxID=161358 RepID=UPI003D8DD024
MKSPLSQEQIAAVERTLSVGTWAITAGAVLFSVLTVTPLVKRVTPPGWDWTAPILPLVVDAAVVIVIQLDSAVSRLGGSGGAWPVVLRWLTGLFTVALNIGDSAWKGDRAGVAVHAVAPLLLIVTAEAGLAYRRAIAKALDRIEREQQAEAERRRVHERREREAREQAERAERERQRQEREAREQAEREREQAERAERERQQERQERAEREAREHAAKLEQQRLDHEAQTAREQREAEAALRREEAEREERRQERERQERASREQQERAERERREREQREDRERAEREQREREARERAEREQQEREARERAEAAARERRERQAVNAGRGGMNASANTRKTLPVNDSRLSEDDA